MAPNHNQQYIQICNGSNSCQQTRIECPTNASCNILCIGENACGNSRVYCGNTANSQCNILCESTPDKNACQYAKFNGIGTIDCDGESSCGFMKFPIAPPGEIYYMDCDDLLSCHNSDIICPKDSECHIRCKGTRSCEHLNVTWPSSNYSSSLTCLDDQACPQSSITPDYVQKLTFGPTAQPTNQPTLTPSTSNPTTTTTVTGLMTCFPVVLHVLCLLYTNRARIDKLYICNEG